MNAEDVAEWHDRSDAIKRAMNGVQKTSHAEQAAAIRELIEERDRLRVALRDAADALELFVDTGAKHREPYETPLSAYDRARAALEPRK